MSDIEVISHVIVEAVKAATAPLVKRLELLEARPIPEHVGAWQDGQRYTAQQCVQLNGSCWCALRVTSAKPGESDAWRLIAKAGRDGKDLR